VRRGKGAKGRNVMLSLQLLGILRTYWRLARPRFYLFPGRDEDHPIDQTVLHAACRSAVKAAGLTERVTLHTPGMRVMARPDVRPHRPTIEIADILRRHGDAYRRLDAGHLGRVEQS
jgi:integrase